MMVWTENKKKSVRRRVDTRPPAGPEAKAPPIAVSQSPVRGSQARAVETRIMRIGCLRSELRPVGWLTDSGQWVERVLC